MNRKLSTFLTLFICSVIMATPAMAKSTDNVGLDTGRDWDTLNGYSERFSEMVDENAELNAKRIVEKEKEVADYLAAKQVSSTEPLESTKSTTVYATTVNYHEQVEDYYCGPATGLQTIENWDYAAAVPGSTSDAKQRTLAGEMDTDKLGATYIADLRDTINKNDYIQSSEAL